MTAWTITTWTAGLAPHTSWCGKGALARQSKHRTPGFSADSGDQGSLCSVATAGIELDELNEEDVKAAGQLPRNSRGINLSDGNCDSFQTYCGQKANILCGRDTDAR